MPTSNDMAAHEHDLIQTRASDATGSILDLAAAIPDRRSFALNDEDYESFLAMLDAPARTDEALRAGMKRSQSGRRPSIEARCDGVLRPERMMR